MMTLVIGGSGSGKSSWAEDYLTAAAEGKKKYYLATMRVFDKEGEKKIERHRQLRSGKGFVTIEQPESIQDALGKMAPGEKTALLECISNLAANEMFSGGTPAAAEAVAEKIVGGIRRLESQMVHLVIVSNNVFEDGIVYDETTMEYIRAMGQINEELAAMAGTVVEMVAGIPVVLKQGG